MESVRITGSIQELSVAIILHGAERQSKILASVVYDVSGIILAAERHSLDSGCEIIQQEYYSYG